ncbi:hypothetical protein LGQ02_03440 [Bacillus shivajii]|uniref:hypothetical protein n=1 Tax=Bacillus shivajii TaxID=1983719 RepID=UPI001CF9EDAC|nr:hypothetical protein [Bacillus shivajii]UCZ53851.1 hypothetical protein LGQ02_03440 [Bacillus shivajii]
MEWSVLMDRIFGFLPERSVFMFAVATAIIVLIVQAIVNKLNNVLETPWKREENLRKRKQLIDEWNDKNKKGETSK